MNEDLIYLGGIEPIEKDKMDEHEKAGADYAIDTVSSLKDKIEKLKTLLQAALCPNVMNGCQDGKMPNPYGEIEQCQWCEERKQALNL